MKRAFSMIELIIGIVVMGIAFSMLPAVLGVSTKTVETTVGSQGFYNGLAKMQIVLSSAWDESNVELLTNENRYYALDTDHAALDCDDTMNRRAGHYAVQDRRKCHDTALAPSAIGLDGGEVANTNYDDIDDYNGDFDDKLFDVSVDVRYVLYNDAAAPGNFVFNSNGGGGGNDIKHITVRVQDPIMNQELARFNYYAGNIGVDVAFVKDNPNP